MINQLLQIEYIRNLQFQIINHIFLKTNHFINLTRNDYIIILIFLLKFVAIYL